MVEIEDALQEFEEIEKIEKKPQQGGNRPEFRVVQADTDANGNSRFVNVGGMWKNISKNGNVFYTLKIGNLKLLVFPNEAAKE